MSPIDLLQTFFRKYHLERSSLLLALSGGPDSLCLFFSLLACKEKIPFDLHVAHVDHGWRDESQKEEEQLRQLVDFYGIPFHSVRLDCSGVKGNLEAYCREERYHFFKSLCHTHSLQGVFVGHHADDQAETVLKRMLEGSHWSYWQGLQEDSTLFGVRVFRPFLSLNKRVLVQWLNENKIKFFHDSTNDLLSFLRPRLRHKVIPWLGREFGKEVSPSLLNLGEEALELKSYFDEKIHGILQKVQQGPFGVYLNLQNQPLVSVEIKYLILQLSKLNGVFLSRTQLQLAASFLQKGVANRLLESGKGHMIVDRKRVFFPNFCPTPFENTPLHFGEQRVGQWDVKVEEKGERDENIGWDKGWQGGIRCVLPMGEYLIGLPKANASFHLRRISLSKWWSNHQVPAFLRSFVPVLWTDKNVYHEFLTGKSPLKENKEKSISIALRYVNPLITGCH